MTLIHEKLYQSDNITNIDFPEYVKTLVRHVYTSYGSSLEQIRLTLTIARLNFDIDTAIPCGLIINELVSNSLKHAFPDGVGTLAIDMRAQSEGAYVLVIGDNGIGMPDELDLERIDSLGLQLVKGLVEDQLDGELERHSEQGTTWTIRFQKSRKMEPIP